MTNLTLIIDANALCHKAKHSLGDLTHETMHVGVIFGFLSQILRYAKEFETNKFAFVWDSKKSHRLKLFPAYKEARRSKEKTPEEIEIDKAAYEQFDRLYEEILPKLKVKNNFKFDGYEGDDLIASIIKCYPEEEFIIASGDEDLYQCLSDNVGMIKGKKLYTKKDFIKEYNIDPAQWSEVKAIAGCDTDGVPGVRGVGEKTAIKYLNDELTPHLKGYKSIVSPEGKAIRNRNVPLVKLPFKDCPAIELQRQWGWSFNGFLDVCNNLNFQYFLKKENLTQWKQHLNML